MYVEARAKKNKKTGRGLAKQVLEEGGKRRVWEYSTS
jgi:hypothetical protein